MATGSFADEYGRDPGDTPERQITVWYSRRQSRERFGVADCACETHELMRIPTASLRIDEHEDTSD